MNEFNSRKLRDEVNVFEGIQRNWLFLAIWIGTGGFQAIIVQFGSVAFNVSKFGLDGNQWGICIGFAAFALVWRFILLIIPTRLFPEVSFM
jgi:Ca2+ transporting ATPase